MRIAKVIAETVRGPFIVAHPLFIWKGYRQTRELYAII